MNKALLIVGLFLITATNTHVGFFIKKKPGRTCVVCKQQKTTGTKFVFKV